MSAAFVLHDNTLDDVRPHRHLKSSWLLGIFWAVFWYKLSSTQSEGFLGICMVKCLCQEGVVCCNFYCTGVRGLSEPH